MPRIRIPKATRVANTHTERAIRNRCDDPRLSRVDPEIESCTILTTEPNSLVSDFHNRMPVIVPPEKYEVWLDPDVTDFAAIRDILQPYEPTLMRRYPFSTKLNNARNDDADSASRITLKTSTQDRLF